MTSLAMHGRWHPHRWTGWPGALACLVAGLAAQACSPFQGARNPAFTADTAPPPVMHLDPAMCLAADAAPGGPARAHAQHVEERLRAELASKSVPLTPEAIAFLCQQLAADKNFFRWEAVGRDWALRPVQRAFLSELAHKVGARTVLVPIVRSPPCWLGYRHDLCTDDREAIFLGLFLASDSGIVLVESEVEIGSAQDVEATDAVVKRLLATIPATYTAAGDDVAPFSVVVLPPGASMEKASGAP